jgi:hypothetical protein
VTSARRSPTPEATFAPATSTDVEILRKNLIRSDIKKGQTHAVTALGRCLTLYGRDTLITALQCIRKLRVVTRALSVQLSSKHCVTSCIKRRNRERRASSYSGLWTKFKFADAWDQIAAGRDKIFPSTASKMMADRVRTFLSRRLGHGVLKEAA